MMGMMPSSSVVSPICVAVYRFKVSSTNIQRTIQSLQANWKTYFPGDQFDYFFLDQHFNEQYKADQRFGQVFGIFTLIAILVGLFRFVWAGILHYRTTHQRDRYPQGIGCIGK